MKFSDHLKPLGQQVVQTTGEVMTALSFYKPGAQLNTPDKQNLIGVEATVQSLLGTGSLPSLTSDLEADFYAFKDEVVKSARNAAVTVIGNPKNPVAKSVKKGAVETLNFTKNVLDNFCR